MERFWNKVKKTKTCWLWVGAKVWSGYGYLVEERPKNSNNNRFQYKKRAHRISWELHHGPIPTGMIVCHKCDVPSCVNPGHLFLGTLADNVADMQKKGRHRGGSSPGERNPSAKLTNKNVEQIKKLLKRGWSQQRIADKYGVSQACISSIYVGNSWVST